MKKKILILITLVFLLTSIVSARIVFKYNFNETLPNKVIDDTGLHNGTITQYGGGTPSFTRVQGVTSGVGDLAVYSQGPGNNVGIAIDTGHQLTSDEISVYTADFWVKAYVQGTEIPTANSPEIFTTGSFPEGGYGNIYFATRENITIMSASYGGIKPVIPRVLDGTWHHITIIKNDDKYYLWKDGINVINITMQPEATTLNNAFLFSTSNPEKAPGDYFNGTIDRFAFYDTVLSASEILELNKTYRCYVDSDCDDNNDYTEDVCLNPGIEESTCQYNNITCFVNSDCGIDRFVGEPFCSENYVTKYFLSFTCSNLGQTNSFCSNETELVNQTCNGVCDNGKCITCTDSDYGFNLFEKGTTNELIDEILDITGTDYCTSQTKNTEYFCNNSRLNFASRNCISGTTCYDGACLSNVYFRCYDSDNGKNLTMQGTANETFRDALIGEATDYCSGTRILEYYCNGNRLYNVTSSCPTNTTCLNGACSPHTCTDSDNGKNLTLQGTTEENFNGVLSTGTDYCSGTRLSEFYCSGSRLINSNFSCPANTTCLSGACVPQLCIDSDDGKNITFQGTTNEYLNGTLIRTATDFCTSTSRVREFYCKSSKMYNTTLSCLANTTCLDGACVV